MKLEPLDRLVAAGTVAGVLGFALVWYFPWACALIFLAVVAFALAVIHDRRTPPQVTP